MQNIAHLFQQAQKMHGKFNQMQVELENKRVEATAGGGMIRAVVNGKGELIKLKIDPEVIGAEQDIEMLEELVSAAVNKALEKSRELVSQEMSKITGGINLPGFFSSMLGS